MLRSSGDSKTSALHSKEASRTSGDEETRNSRGCGLSSRWVVVLAHHSDRPAGDACSEPILLWELVLCSFSAVQTHVRVWIDLRKCTWCSTDQLGKTNPGASQGPRAGKFYAHEEDRHALHYVMWTASEGDPIITCVAVAGFLTKTGVGEGAPGVATQ